MKKYAYLYNCYVTLNGERTNIELDDFLDKIIPLDPKEKFKSLSSGEFTFKAMMPDSNPATSRNRKIGFGKYRDRKPYESEKGTDIAELIKKDVLEMTSTLFIPRSRLAVIEYNHYGPRVNSIAQYLSSFFPKTDKEKWEIEFCPVESELGWEDIEISNDIRSIEIKLDISGRSRHFISKKQNPDSLLYELIRKTVEAHSDFGANTATLKFGNGKKRNGIKSRELLTLLELLELDSELFESVRIKYKSVIKREVVEIDLKNAGVKSISLQNVNNESNWEFVCNEISTEYYNSKEPGSTNFVKHGPFKPVSLPDIIK
jgi:hypothetical protein